jgi:hypothetical protein
MIGSAMKKNAERLLWKLCGTSINMNTECVLREGDNDMSENKLMVVQQLPVIEEKLITIKEEFEAITSEALALVCNEDTYKFVKEKRAEITAIYNGLEADRKNIKKAILEPYEKLEAVYNQCVNDIYTDAKNKLDAKVNEVEDGIKSAKAEKVKAFFVEYAIACEVAFISFENSGIKITMTASEKKLKEQAKEYIDKVVADIALIRTQPEEYQPEMMVEYKQSLNVNQAISTVIERAERVKAEAAKTEVEESKPEVKEEFSPDQEELLTVSFTVRGTLKQISSLQKFCSYNNIEIVKE